MIGRLLLFLLLTGQILGQNPLIEIFGQVLNEQTLKPIPEVYVAFRYNDSIQFSTRSDSNGNYNFFVSKKALTKKTRLNVWYDYNEYRQKQQKDTGCRFTTFFRGYLTPYIIVSSDSIKDSKIHCVILMKPVVADIRFPTIYFQKNTTAPIFDMREDPDWQDPKNTLKFMACILLNYPTIVIECVSHASSDETNAQKLSADRGNFILSYFVSKGINPKQIKIIPHGDSQPLYDNKKLKLVKTKEEKEAMLGQNRRLTFKILSFDFSEEK